MKVSILKISTLKVSMLKIFMLKKSFLLFLVACTILSFATAGYSSNTIKIGVAGAHTGELSSYGLPTTEAVKVVVDQINAKGGVLGKQVEIILQDDQCQASLASNVANNLVAAGVVAVIGHTCSGPSKAALPIYQDANIILLSPSATSPHLNPKGDYTVFFRTISSDDQQARAAVDFMLANLKADRIAIIHDKSDYGKGYADFSAQFLKDAGKEVILFEGITKGATDYSATVEKIRRANPDIIMFGGYHPEASKILRQIRRRNIEAPFVSDDGIRVDTFIQVAKENAEGVYATSPSDVSQLPAYQSALAAYKAAYNNNTPGDYFTEATAATQAILAAIERAGTTDIEKVMHELRTNPAETALGALSFNSIGNAENVGYTVFQVQNGAFVELKK